MKFVQLAGVTEITGEQQRFPKDATGEVVSLTLAPDGTTAAVGLNSGVVLVCFIEVPLLTASRGPIAVYSESLSSLAILDLMKKKKQQITLEAQPQRLGACVTEVAVASSNRWWFYDTSDCSLITSIEALMSVDQIQVGNDAYAVLTNGAVTLGFFDSSKRPFVFPDFDTQIEVTSYAITCYLLLLATDNGALRMFNTRNQTFVEGRRHPSSRAGMKKTAFEIATKLLQPGYEAELRPNMLRKIQTTDRRKETSEVGEERAKCLVLQEPDEFPNVEWQIIQVAGRRITAACSSSSVSCGAVRPRSCPVLRLVHSPAAALPKSRRAVVQGRFPGFRRTWRCLAALRGSQMSRRPLKCVAIVSSKSHVGLPSPVAVSRARVWCHSSRSLHARPPILPRSRI
jgi:hypothetical protein